MSKIYLNVAFDDKDEAKEAGAKWDAGARKWYFWQDGDTPLPAALERFAPVGGAKSEASINAEIGEIIATVQAGIPAAITSARTDMAAAVAKSTDPLVAAAAAHVAEVADSDITNDALDLLAALASTQRDNLDRFLAGKAADPCRALLSVFGSTTQTAKDRLTALRGASADVLVREAMRRIGRQFASAKNAAEKEARKAEAMAKAEAIIAAIDAEAIDYNAESFVVGGATITLGIGNMSWMYINTINGRRDVVSSAGEFCAWLDQMPSAQALNDRITDKWLAGVVDRSIKSNKFERRCAREALAKRAERTAK